MAASPRPIDPDETFEGPWQRLARAFVHEARSPLNALGIYLELLTPREGGQPSNVDPARLVERAQEQVRRVTELLTLFGDVWCPRSERGCDLAGLTRATVRFAKHEAVRHSIELEATIPDTEVPLAIDPGPLADALVRLLDGALGAPEEARVTLAIAANKPQLSLSLSVPRGDLLEAGVRAFEALGASVRREESGVLVSFA